jgi:ATP-dependent DNA helicase RecG
MCESVSTVRESSIVELLQLPIERIHGVGSVRAKAFSALGVESVYDLLTYYPRRYIDRTRQSPLVEAALDQEILVLGLLSDVSSRRLRGGKVMVEAKLSDGHRRCKLVFFNQPWRQRQLESVREVAVFGKLQSFRSQFQMTNPIVDTVGDRTGVIVPIYPMSEKAHISTWDVHRAIKTVFSDPSFSIFDPVPKDVIERFGLLDRDSAYRYVHLAETLDQAKAARQRLIFDELFRLQLTLVARKARYLRESRGVTHEVSPYACKKAERVSLVGAFISSLPFPLTKAQERVVSEIARDMEGPAPMHRLVQGDVGSGKTLVALVSMLFSVQSGMQAALLAPTEVLAEQHFLSLSKYLKDFEVKDQSTYSLFQGSEKRISVGLLKGSLGAKRKSVVEGVRSGEIDIVVGTHALLSEGVSFRSLGLVVVDEQHRFGVDQRAVLRARDRQGEGRDPDTLVMTATPIPRTAAMTVYGDLDVSVVDQLPPGRTPIKTIWLSGDTKGAYEHLLEEVGVGGQGYVVCPLVEGSDKVVAKSAVMEFERLKEGPLRGVRVGLMHGQMSADEKDRVMEAFRCHEIDVLVATTVIEVGVDVPNATMMVIEDADRFGIAQLHQLRGRVGRGKKESFCYLLSNSDKSQAEERLRALERSTDGFFLAEKDLELRGEGTIFGTRQRGNNDLKLASLVRDRDIVPKTREVAEAVISSDPTLFRAPQLKEEIRELFKDEDVRYLFMG